jgi:hypothetical protein
MLESGLDLATLHMRLGTLKDQAKGQVKPPTRR